MKLSQKLLFLLGTSFLLASCGKSYTCTHGIDYLSPGMVFKGFTSGQLSHVVIKMYKANTNFSELISNDTFDASGGYLKGDTMLVKDGENYRGFIPVEKGIDYEIVVVAFNKFYRITDIKSGVETETWTDDTPCSPGASMNKIMPLYMKLNGTDYSCFDANNALDPHRYLLCITH